MSFSIKGKTAIVTGSANGIGLAIARHFADSGANVMCADMDEDQLLVEHGKQADLEGSNVAVFGGDLREKLNQANLLSATIDLFDRVDILVNASRQVELTDVLDTDDDTVGNALRQNLLTGYSLTKVVAKRMISQAEGAGDDDGLAGSIINLSSIAARLSQPELIGYSVSMAAVEQMTRSLALALAANRIRVNCVAFGSVMSGSLLGSLKEEDELRDAILGATPLGRIAEASEVAESVQFLASASSGFVTGQVLTIDGGRSLLDAVRSPRH